MGHRLRITYLGRVYKVYIWLFCRSRGGKHEHTCSLHDGLGLRVCSLYQGSKSQFRLTFVVADQAVTREKGQSRQPNKSAKVEETCPSLGATKYFPYFSLLGTRFDFVFNNKQNTTRAETAHHTAFSPSVFLFFYSFSIFHPERHKKVGHR